MKIAALQMVSGPDVAHNLETAWRLAREAARGGAQLVALPEYFCHLGAGERAKLEIAEAPGDGPIQRMLASVARELGVWMIGGTLPLRCDDPGRVRNANCVYAPDGSLAARYDKIHLFRYDNGRESYDESRVIEAGAVPQTVQAGALRVGLSVCYDLRFPELYRKLTFEQPHPPCDLLSVPSAFTHTTGSAHWHILLRARAIENQCYVIAPAQGGTHANGRRTYGHSLIVDPWGEIVAELPEGEGAVLADVDPQRLAAVRRELPALDHRRL